MSIFLLVLLVIASSMVVMIRAVCIINKLHWTTFGKTYWHFLAFGSSYVALAVGSLLALVQALHGVVEMPSVLVVAASAGLILFDKRSARREWEK